MSDLPEMYLPLYRFFRSEFNQARRSGFDFMRKTPDTTVWRKIRVYNEVDDTTRESFCDFAARRATLQHAWIVGLPRFEIDMNQFEAVVVYERSIFNDPDLASVSMLRMLRMFPSPEGVPYEQPDKLWKLAHSTVDVKTPEIKRAVKQALGAFAVSRPRKILSTGGTAYPCVHDGTAFEVRLHWNRHTQLGYRVHIPALGGGEDDSVSYETSVGLGYGEWDFLTADNLAESMNHFVEVVRRSLALPKRILATMG
jgi:hypothetical protein